MKTGICRHLVGMLSCAVSLVAPFVAEAAPLRLELQLTSSASINTGVVPGHSYSFVYTGAVTGSQTGDFVHTLNIEPESAWWPAAEVAWDSLYLSTPKGTLTLALASSRLLRVEPTDTLPWLGSGTWAVVGGTGIFAGATGRGTLALNVVTDPASRTNTLAENVNGTITIDAAPPVVVLDRGSARTPTRGPNGRLAVEVQITDPILSSGLRSVEVRGKNAVIVRLNEDPIAAAPLQHRREFLPGTAVRRLDLLVESTDNFSTPDIQVVVTDWAGNTTTL